MSRNGYVVVDDTNRPRFDNSDWPWVLNTTFPPASAADCNSVSLDDVRYHKLYAHNNYYVGHMQDTCRIYAGYM